MLRIDVNRMLFQAFDNVLTFKTRKTQFINLRGGAIYL